MHVRRLGRATLLGLILIALVWPAPGPIGAAQRGDDLAGVDDDTYTSPSWGYRIEWDDRVWTPTVATSENDVDFLRLESRRSTLIFQGGAGYRGDAADCLADLVDAFSTGEGVSRWRPLEDARGDPIAGEDDDRAFAAFRLRFTDSEGSRFDNVNYLECRTLVPQRAVLMIVHVTALDDYEREAAEVEEVLDSIDLATEEVEPTPTPRRRRTPTPEVEEDPTATPRPRRTPTPTEEVEADPTSTPRPRRTRTPTPEAPTTGIDQGEYESPTWGYTLEWDPDVWEAAPDREVVGGRDGLDRLQLRNGISLLWIEGVARYDGDVELCLEGEADLLASEDGVEDFAPLEDRRGRPIEGETDDGGVYAAFALTLEGEIELVDHIECRELVPGEAVLIVTLVSPADDYEDQLDEADEVIETLNLRRVRGR